MEITGQDEIECVIAKAAGDRFLTRKEREIGDRFLTRKEREMEGARILKRKLSEGTRILKRKLLGLCGSQSIKTLEEIAQVLHSTGIASSLEEGKSIVPSLVGKRINYGKGLAAIEFEEVEDGKGNKKYRVSGSRYRRITD